MPFSGNNKENKRGQALAKDKENSKALPNQMNLSVLRVKVLTGAALNITTKKGGSFND